MRVKILLYGSFVFCFMHIACANLIFNGSFEEGPFEATMGPNDPGIMNLNWGSTLIPGWRVLGGARPDTSGPVGDISWVDNSCLTSYSSDGSKFLDLTGWNNDYSSPHGGIALNQMVKTIPGQSYLLSFDVGGSRAVDGGKVPQITVSINANPSTFVFNGNVQVPDAPGFQNMWEHTSLVFSASNDALFLEFQGTNPEIMRVNLLDNVSLVPVPEPSSAALLMIALLLRLRSK